MSGVIIRVHHQLHSSDAASVHYEVRIQETILCTRVRLDSAFKSRFHYMHSGANRYEIEISQFLFRPFVIVSSVNGVDKHHSPSLHYVEESSNE